MGKFCFAFITNRDENVSADFSTIREAPLPPLKCAGITSAAACTIANVKRTERNVMTIRIRGRKGNLFRFFTRNVQHARGIFFVPE